MDRGTRQATVQWGGKESDTNEQVTHKQMNYSYTQLLQTEYFCTSPKSLVETLSSPLPLDGIIMWCLWKVVRIRWSHEGGTLINEISALIGVTKEFASPSLFSAMRGYKEKSAVCRPEEGPHQNTPMLSFCSQTSSLPNCEKWISVVYKTLSHLGCFLVLAILNSAAMNTDVHVHYV